MREYLSLLFILLLFACKNQESTRNDLSSFDNYQNKASYRFKDHDEKENTEEPYKIENKQENQKQDSTQGFAKHGKKFALATKNN